MTARERLIELLLQTETFTADYAESARLQAEYKANHLLANGVICPPCKVEFMSVRISQYKTAVFFEADLLDEDGNPTGSDCWFWDHYIGESVFLTREEAEKALAERSKE